MSCSKEDLKEFFTNLKIVYKNEIIVFSEKEIDLIVYSKCLDSYKIKTLAILLPQRFIKNVSNFEISAKKWKKICLKKISLFCQLPETINNNIERSAELLGLSKEEFLISAKKQVPLFCQSPETINSNIERSAELLGLSKEEFLISAKKQITIFYRTPETINNKIEKSAKLLGLSKKEFLKIAQKQVPLFCQSPETVNNNIERSAQLLGLSKKDFLKIAQKKVQLFCLSPKTVEIKYKIILTFFDYDIQKTHNYILKYPSSLISSEERLYIFKLAQDLFGIRVSCFIKNPEKLLKNNFEKEDNLLGWKKLESALFYFKKITKEETKKRKEKKLNISRQ